MVNNSVNAILRKYGTEYRRENPFLSYHHQKVMNALEQCRTESLGGRIDICDTCGHAVKVFHSCRNRQCPQCQFMKKEEWIAVRKDEVFPFQYFHVVFTLPHKLNPIVIRNNKIIYDLLFSKVKETLLSAAQDTKYFGAEIGFFSILHTWGQKLNLHPHLHCVVPGGGYSSQKRAWIKAAKDYLLPVQVLKMRFRSLFLTELKRLYLQNELILDGTEYRNREQFQKLIDELFNAEWVCYLKESFKNSDSVIEYLARYTHRIAISNYRIKKVENGEVFFTFKDYKDENRKKTMHLEVQEFIRRFLLHIVPNRFVRIRYYGLMANRNKKKNLERCFEFYKIKRSANSDKKKWEDRFFDVTGIDLHKCNECKTGNMIFRSSIPAKNFRPPPIICA